MSRRKRALKRPTIAPDKTFGSVLVSRLINRVMKDGKKSVANRIVTEALVQASEELKVAPLEVIETVVTNVKPKIEVKSMRVGGSNYQVPMEPYPARALRLGLTWIVDSARSIKGQPMVQRLKTILVQTFNNEGPAIQKKETVHQTAAGNKAFAHFALRLKKR